MPIKINYTIREMPFKYPFTISKGSKTHQPILFVELEYFGFKGYGEAPAISYYNIPIEKMVDDLEKKKSFIEKFAFSDPERFWHFLHHLFPENSFLVCALDMAGWDLFGKMKRKQLYKIWNLESSNAPVTDYTIGIDRAEIMVKKMKEMPWPVYKIKVGFEGDVEIIRELRKHTDVLFRLDANAAWSIDTALEKINHFKDLGVAFIEQPLAKDNWDDMKLLYQNAAVPLFADESCVLEHDVKKCVGHFHGINIKLTKCGGITPAKRMIQMARGLGLKIMIGCMNESTIGTAAIAQLAPLADYIDNDGTLLQTEQFGIGISFDYGKMIYTDSDGLGVKVEWDDNH